MGLNPVNEKNHSVEENKLGENETMPKFLQQLEKWVHRFNNALHYVSAIILFLLMFITVGDVFGRFALNNPITGTYELTGLALALIIFFSLGRTQMVKEHIDIDFFMKKVSLKTQQIIHLCIALFLFIFMILVTWQLYEFAMRTMLGKELSGDLGISLHIFIFLTTIGAIAFTLTFLTDFFRLLFKVVNNR